MSTDRRRQPGMTRSDYLILAGLVSGVLTVAMLVFWIIPSYFEASTYNRLTKATLSTWDAMWVELRVTEPLRTEDVIRHDEP